MDQLEGNPGLDALAWLSGPSTDQLPGAQPQVFRNQEPEADHIGPPGANDRFFTVRRNSGRISPCLPYHTAFKNKRIRETSPERVGIRWDISSPLCPLPPRFSSL